MLGTYEEAPPKKGRKRKRIFKIVHEEKIIAQHEDIRAIADEILERERKKRRNKKLAMIILLEGL